MYCLRVCHLKHLNLNRAFQIVIGFKIIKNPGIEDPAFVHPGRVKSAVYVKGMIECWNNGKLDIKK